MTETWQEMAARLRVEAKRHTFPYGKTHGIFKKNGRYTEVCPGYRCQEWRVMVDENTDYGEIPGFLTSSQARDLSDCLQVAARYLEEVHG